MHLINNLKESEVDSEKLKQQRERMIEEKQRNLKKLGDEQNRLQKQSGNFKTRRVKYRRALLARIKKVSRCIVSSCVVT